MFIDKNGNIYLGDLQPGDREATQEEIQAYTDKQNKDNHNNQIQQQIKEIELKSIRALRGALLNGDKTELKKHDDDIKELTKQLIK